MKRISQSRLWVPSGILAIATLSFLFQGAVPVANAATSTIVPNPALFERVGGVDTEENIRHSLALADLKLDVDIVGVTAQITLEAHFANPSRDTLEGDFSLTLPEGAVVNGYALDVNGNMLDGVLADQPKAIEVYESKIRKRIDPGVATVSLGNVFSTRIFPIAPESGRTIRVKFAAPVYPGKGLLLPLMTESEIGHLTIDVHAEGINEAPTLVLPVAGELSWKKNGTAYVAKIERENVALAGNLNAVSKGSKGYAFVTRHANGGKFFEITDQVRLAAKQAKAPRRIRIYWDRSRSRYDAKLDEEISLIKAYMAATKPQAVDIIVFNSSGAEVQTINTGDEAEKLLRHTVYRGATSFDVLRDVRVARADSCLLFSDGIVSIDRRDRFAPDCAMTAITSSAQVDRGYLQRLVGGSRGEVISLNRLSLQDALTRLRQGQPSIRSVRDDTGQDLNFVVLSNEQGRFSIVGEAPRSGNIVVEITGSGSARTLTREYPIARAVFKSDGAGALWAAEKIAALSAVERDTELRKVSRAYSIASPAMAFLVLESPEDYANADLEPPARYPEEDRLSYVEAKAELDKQRAEEKSERLGLVIEAWEAQKAWWKTDFSHRVIAGRKQRTEPNPSLSYDARRSAAGGGGGGGGGDGLTDLAEIVVTGSLIRGVPQESGMPVNIIDESRTTIELEPWNPKRPYLQALDAAAPFDVDRVLAEQELEHGQLPAFYLDVAEWLSRHDRKRDALEMLLSALDLPSRNAETLVVVADRMVRYQQFDRAVWLYESTLKLASGRPQPMRTLSLALEKRAEHGARDNAVADLERALDLLNQVVMTPWNDAYEGIEVVALMDANAMIPKLRQLGGGIIPIDRRLIAPLDVDLRVVIEWNTGSTDLDLWIDEPTKERAMYSNPETQIGGRLSNDMTSGFGPEEYLLRRARDGQYEIRVDVYATDSINPNGASTVTAHLFRDFGRKGQREEIIDIELVPDDEGDSDGERLVGKFVVAKNPKLSATSN
jgi:hypothetical protein